MKYKRCSNCGAILDSIDKMGIAAYGYMDVDIESGEDVGFHFNGRAEYYCKNCDFLLGETYTDMQDYCNKLQNKEERL